MHPPTLFSTHSLNLFFKIISECDGQWTTPGFCLRHPEERGAKPSLAEVTPIFPLNFTFPKFLEGYNAQKSIYSSPENGWQEFQGEAITKQPFPLVVAPRLHS